MQLTRNSSRRFGEIPLASLRAFICNHDTDPPFASLTCALLQLSLPRMAKYILPLIFVASQLKAANPPDANIIKSRPPALIQKGDQQALGGLRSGMSVSLYPKVAEDELKRPNGIWYRKGEKKPFTGTKVGSPHVMFADPREWVETPILDGKIQGTEIWYYQDGSMKRESFYGNGTRQGLEIRYYQDGSRWLETPFVDGKRHGMEIGYHKDGSTKSAETPHVQGKRQGTSIWYHKTGSKRMEMPYVDDSPHGTAIEYREDGSKESETVWAKNIRQSKIWYRKDGTKWREIPDYDHPLVDIPIYYDKNGIKIEPPMVNGKHHGMVLGFYEDGSKWIETPYVEDKIHGTRISYHEDGSIQATTPYLDGKKDGPQIWYYKDGSRIVTHYVNDKMHGPQIWYRKDGSIKRESFYEHGRKISDEEY